MKTLDIHWQSHFNESYTKNNKGSYRNLNKLFDKALVNSKRALNDAEASNEMNPSTEIHILVEHLLQIKK